MLASAGLLSLSTRVLLLRSTASMFGMQLVAELDCVPVEQLVIPVMAGEMLIKQAEELFADVGLDIEAEWWVEPNYISCPVPLTLYCVSSEGYPLHVTAVCKGFVVFWRCTVELLLVTGVVGNALADHRCDLLYDVGRVVGLDMNVLRCVVGFSIRIVFVTFQI